MRRTSVTPPEGVERGEAGLVEADAVHEDEALALAHDRHIAAEAHGRGAGHLEGAPSPCGCREGPRGVDRGAGLGERARRGGHARTVSRRAKALRRTPGRAPRPGAREQPTQRAGDGARELLRAGARVEAGERAVDPQRREAVRRGPRGEDEGGRVARPDDPRALALGDALTRRRSSAHVAPSSTAGCSSGRISSGRNMIRMYPACSTAKRTYATPAASKRAIEPTSSRAMLSRRAAERQRGPLDGERREDGAPVGEVVVGRAVGDPRPARDLPHAERPDGPSSSSSSRLASSTARRRSRGGGGALFRIRRRDDLRGESHAPCNVRAPPRHCLLAD